MKILWGRILPVELQSRDAVHFKSKLKIPSEPAGSTRGPGRRGPGRRGPAMAAFRRGALQAPRSPPWRPWAARRARGRAVAASRAGSTRLGPLGMPWALGARAEVSADKHGSLLIPSGCSALPACCLRCSSPLPAARPTKGFCLSSDSGVLRGFASGTCQFLRKSCRAG